MFTNTTTPITATRTPGNESPEDGTVATFDHAFKSEGVNRTTVLSALEETLGALRSSHRREERLREIAKAATLSTARCHGNIIETARILLGNIDELGARFELNIREAKDQFMLGLAEGACQVGPIVYGRFLDIASEYRDNADDWIVKNRRRPVAFEPAILPVIVPFEETLTLSSKPFLDSTPVPAPATAPVPSEATVDESPNLPVTLEMSASINDTLTSEAPPTSEESSTTTWSRPKGKGFFRRLSDVMGNFFSGNRS